MNTENNTAEAVENETPVPQTEGTEAQDATEEETTEEVEGEDNEGDSTGETVGNP